MKAVRTQDDQDKRLLEAVLYVLGDMPSPEREAFEQRLLDDQAAREAVAEAVLICQTASDVLSATASLRVASPSPAEVPASPTGMWRAKAWTMLALAASLLIAVTVGIRLKLVPSDGIPGVASAGDGNLLAVAWLDSASLADSADASVNEDVLSADESAGDDEPAEEEEEFAPLDVDNAPESSGVAPEGDWLFEAVTAPPTGANTSGIAGPQEG